MQLSFSYTFDYASDEIFCCYTIPYTYTEMQAHLNQLYLMKNEVVRIESVGKSIGGLVIPLVKISTKPNLPVVMLIGR